MKYFKKIPGERIYLSPLSLEDVEKCTNWLNDRAVTEGLGDSHMVINIANEKEWIENALKKGEYQFSIVCNDNNEAIG